MAKLSNLARMTVSSAPGTGSTIGLSAAVSGFISFADSGIVNGDVVTYAIVDGSNREIGTATYSSTGPSLSGRTVLNSTNSNAPINATATAEVGVTASATDLADKLSLSGGTMTGKVILPASTTSSAFLNLPHGVAPTAPTNGDIWTTTSGLIARINGTAVTHWNSSNMASLNQAEAEAGTGSVNRAWTSARVRQNVAAYAAPIVHAHAIADTTGLQTALDLKAPLASPTFTGTPLAPTATAGTNSDQLATTAFVATAISGLGGGSSAGTTTFTPAGNIAATNVQSAIEELDAEKAPLSHTQAISTITGLQTALDGKAALTHTHAIADTTGLQAALDLNAPLASPALTGTPTVPTAATATNTTQAASTAFVQANMALKAGTSTATTGANGLMSSTDKTKLDAVGTMANRALTISTSDPSGGADGDIWFKVT